MDTLKLERTTLEEIKKILIAHGSKINRELIVWKPKEKIGRAHV